MHWTQEPKEKVRPLCQNDELMVLYKMEIDPVLYTVLLVIDMTLVSRVQLRNYSAITMISFSVSPKKNGLFVFPSLLWQEKTFKSGTIEENRSIKLQISIDSNYFFDENSNYFADSSDFQREKYLAKVTRNKIDSDLVNSDPIRSSLLKIYQLSNPCVI
jgi:hypothetical protein